MVKPGIAVNRGKRNRTTARVRLAVIRQRTILQATVLLTLVFFVAREVSAGGDLPRPPNVLLIISDDQAWTDYGFMGHRVIQTPNLDRLARQSATFRRGYVPSALCRPSLASIITGLYPHQHGITGNDPAIPNGKNEKGIRQDPDYLALKQRLIAKLDDHPTLPHILAERNFSSFQSGKWWEGDFRRGGFTHGMTHGDPDRGGRHGDAGLKIGRQGMEPLFDFIRQARSTPFFIWYAPFLPHTPHNPPARLLEKYLASDRPVELARYYAMCEWFDETCGQLTDVLDQNGLRENTLVVYVTDNGWIQRTPRTAVPTGWKAGSFAPKSKQSPYDGGIRTPIMIRWPGKIQPAFYDDVLVSSLDLAPTILAACGVEPSPQMTGTNLLDVCSGASPGRRAVFGETYAHDVADVDAPARSLLFRWCVEDQWKLILSHPGEARRYAHAVQHYGKDPQLYDLNADPLEKRNLALAHPDIVLRLTKRIDQWHQP